MTTGTLTGKYHKADGTPLTGKVYVTPSVGVVRDETGNVILSGTTNVELDNTGAFSVALAASDDLTLDPSGVTYKVSLRSVPPVVGVFIPAGQSVDMADVTPVDPAAPTYAVQVSHADVADAVAVETSRATGVEALKVNASTYTAGQATQDAALASEATTARAAEGGLRNLTDATFASNLLTSITGIGGALFAALLSTITDAVTLAADGALTVGKVAAVDAGAAPRSMTLADGTAAGQTVAAEKADSGTNLITITGSIRAPGGAGTITLAYPLETILFVWTGTYWFPLVNHRTKSSIDTQVDDRLAASPSVVSAAASAASSAVSTALSAAGVLAAGTAPALQTNRALDPQLKTTGAGTSGSYSTAQITTGLPAGFSFGRESTRSGSLTGTISSIRISPSTNSDALRVPVTVGETLTCSAYQWTDQPTPKFSLQEQYYDSSGATVGSLIVGTGVSGVASTWLRTSLTSTVPASASYLSVLAVSVTTSGNTVAGAKGRVTGLQVDVGSTALTYGDGANPGAAGGWYWSGTAHATASKRVLATTGDFATSNAQLIAWAANLDNFAISALTRDTTGGNVIATFTGTWPDGSAATYTTTAYYAVGGMNIAVNAYTILHAASGKTVTQPAMTRNSAGDITVRPVLTIA